MARLRMVEYQGESMCVKELARRTGLSYSALWHRISNEYMTGDEAVAAVRASSGLYDVGGELLTPTQMAERCGLHADTIRERLRRGFTPTEAMKPRKVKPKDADGPTNRLKSSGLYDVGGELLTPKQMAERCGLHADTIRERLRRGFTPTEAMKPRKVKPKDADGPTNRLKWPEKAFALIYNPDAKEIMRFRRLNENNWSWTSNFFTYMASKLGKRHVLLRAWWRESEEPAMLRLYLLEERDGKDDVLTEVVMQGHKEAVLRKWGLA